MTGEMGWSDIGPNRFARRGRLLTVAGTRWRWRVGRGGNVIAYSMKLTLKEHSLAIEREPGRVHGEKDGRRIQRSRKCAANMKS
jgi:hypothetical protein